MELKIRNTISIKGVQTAQVPENKILPIMSAAGQSSKKQIPLWNCNEHSTQAESYWNVQVLWEIKCPKLINNQIMHSYNIGHNFCKSYTFQTY